MARKVRKMIRGRVKAWVAARGFGFVTPLDNGRNGRDIFVHVNECPAQLPLIVGELVDFEYAIEAKGPRATYVERVGAVAEAES